jgi:hypothetical protein
MHLRRLLQAVLRIVQQIIEFDHQRMESTRVLLHSDEPAEFIHGGLFFVRHASGGLLSGDAGRDADPIIESLNVGIKELNRLTF